MATGRDVLEAAGELPLRDRLLTAIACVERSTGERTLSGTDRVRLLLALDLVCDVSQRTTVRPPSGRRRPSTSG